MHQRASRGLNASVFGYTALYCIGLAGYPYPLVPLLQCVQGPLAAVFEAFQQGDRTGKRFASGQAQGMPTGS